MFILQRFRVYQDVYDMQKKWLQMKFRDGRDTRISLSGIIKAKFRRDDRDGY